jgi:predicted transposase YbfD/YdcC
MDGKFKFDLGIQIGVYMHSKHTPEAIRDLFSVVDDYRINPVSYPVDEVLSVTIFGLSVGYSKWSDISDFGYAALDIFREYLPFYNGVPPAQTLARIVSNLDNGQIKILLVNMANTIRQERVMREDKHIALDGKYIGGGLSTVSAFVTDTHLVLDHSAPYTQGNELQAIKKMIEILDLSNCIVTIDGIGCQKAIVKDIKNNGGEAVISLKGNQSYLHKQTRNFFEDMGSAIKELSHDTCMSIDKEHGRIEERNITVLYDLKHIPEAKEWPEIEAIAAVKARRWIKNRSSEETRYFVLTKKYTAQESLKIIRDHWQIENNLHWILDVNLREDRLLRFAKSSKANTATLRRIVLNAIQSLKEEKVSLYRTQRRISMHPDRLRTAINTILNILLTP